MSSWFHRPLSRLGRCCLCPAAWVPPEASTRTFSWCWSLSSTSWHGTHTPLTHPRCGSHLTEGHRTVMPGEGVRTRVCGLAQCPPGPHCPLATAPASSCTVEALKALLTGDVPRASTRALGCWVGRPDAVFCQGWGVPPQGSHMDCSTLGSPVLYYPPEFAQSRVH